MSKQILDYVGRNALLIGGLTALLWVGLWCAAIFHGTRPVVPYPMVEMGTMTQQEEEKFESYRPITSVGVIFMFEIRGN